MLNDHSHLKMSVKPSILFLSSWYPTNENPTHGIFIREQALALSQHASVVSIYAYSTNKVRTPDIEISKQGNLTELLLSYPKTNIGFPLFKQLIQFYNYRAAYKKLLHYLISNKITVSAIQLNVAYPAAMILPLFKKHYAVKHTIAEHWSGYLSEDGNYKGLIQKYFTKKCVANASKIFYVSEKQKASMIAHGLNGNYELLYNVVDTSIFKPVSKAQNQLTTFLHVSSLVEREKNLTGTFEALKKLQDKNYTFRLIIIGGDQKAIEETKTLQSKIGLKNIEYLGYQNKTVISYYMNESDGLLLFSNYEGMPVVALEALACGLPVFASRVGHLPNLIQKEFGTISETNNILAYSQQLEDFINGKLSFDKIAMHDFILKHASYQSVGKQLFDTYSAL